MCGKPPKAFFADREKPVDEGGEKAPLVLLQLGESKKDEMIATVKVYVLHNNTIAAFFKFHKIGSLDDGPSLVYLGFCGADAGIVLKLIPDSSVLYRRKQLG
jgi:hypothetical protein